MSPRLNGKSSGELPGNLYKATTSAPACQGFCTTHSLQEDQYESMPIYLCQDQGHALIMTDRSLPKYRGRAHQYQCPHKVSACCICMCTYDMPISYAPTIWNSLPADICACTFYGSFICQMKTFYFNKCF